MSLPGYACYKETGVEWLGELPDEWDSLKLRLSLLEPPCYGVLVPDFQVDGVPMMRITDIQNGIVAREDLVTISQELSDQYRRTIVRAGDVLLSVVGTIGEVVLVDESLAGVNLSRAIARLQVVSRIEHSYLAWVLRSDVFNRYVDLVCVGSAQRVLNMSDLSAFTIPVPPPRHQHAIATFLDRETAKIDALIAEQEKLLALLAEKRQATISHAVTRGLNPNAPMKDSGIPWLGKVPAHWRVMPLKYLVSFKSGGTPSKENLDYWDGAVPWASAKDLKSDYLADTADHLTQFAVDSGAASLFPVGVVLVVVRGMILARTFPVTETLSPMAINQDLKALVPNHGLDPSYLAWLLRGTAAESLQRLDEAGHGTKALRMDTWGSMDLPVPPEDEQRQIVASLLDRLDAMDRLVADAGSAINLLKERRSALVSAAVTGKIDVRHAA